MSYERHNELWKAIRKSQFEVDQFELEATRLEESFEELQAEVEKLNSIIDELRDENESLKSVNREMSEDLMRIARGGDA